jgi:uncharacterized protein YbcI
MRLCRRLASTLETPATGRDPLLAISNGMVRLYKEALGRGPRRARTSYAGPDALVVVLEHTLTTAERSLVRLGEDRRLQEARLIVQSALEPQARALVEEVLERRTVAFVTGLDPLRDLAAVFLSLEPRDQISDGQSALRSVPPR